MAVVAPIGAVMGMDIATPGIMKRIPRPAVDPGSWTGVLG